jgi:hypothetical protein
VGWTGLEAQGQGVGGVMVSWPAVSSKTNAVFHCTVIPSDAQWCPVVPNSEVSPEVICSATSALELSVLEAGISLHA